MNDRAQSRTVIRSVQVGRERVSAGGRDVATVPSLSACVAMGAWSLLTLGCPPASSPSDAATDGPIARFEVPAQGSLDWGTVPFPCELYRGADGAVTFGSLPVRGAPAVWNGIRDALRTRRGFGVRGHAFVVVDGEIDPATLLAEPGAGNAPVVLMAIDDTSPLGGALVPVADAQWDPVSRVISVRPAPGTVLRRTRRYVYAFTSRIRSPSGTALRPSAQFARARDLPPDPTDAALARARDVVDPALTALVRVGVDRASVVALASFTTDDVPSHAVAVRDLVAVAPMPEIIAIDSVWPGPRGTLDDLFGAPSELRPGRDVADVSGVAGRRGVVHATIAAVVSGRLRAARVVGGSGSNIGIPHTGSDGRLGTTGTDEIPFLLSVPRGADFARMPLLVVHGAAGETRADAMTFADTAGRAGIAVLGFDAYLHGRRAASARDTTNALSGATAPDGLEEHDTLDVLLRMLGARGSDAARTGDPSYLLGAATQFTADVLSILRFVRHGDLRLLRAADAALASLAFDPARVNLLGVATGGMVAHGVLAVDAGIASAVLAVHPGSFTELLATSPPWRGWLDQFVRPSLGIVGDFDERTRRLETNPAFDLVRWLLDPVEAASLAPYVLRFPTTLGPPPDVLWLLAGGDEIALPPSTEALIAAAEVPGIGEFGFAPVTLVAPGALPLRANLVTLNGPVTAAAVRYGTATHALLSLLHDTSQFVPPLVQPLTSRTSPIPVTNPIVAAHAMMESFLRARVTSGRASINAP